MTVVPITATLARVAWSASVSQRPSDRPTLRISFQAVWTPVKWLRS